jgi:hypothetical protein
MRGWRGNQPGGGAGGAAAGGAAGRAAAGGDAGRAAAGGNGVALIFHFFSFFFLASVVFLPGSSVGEGHWIGG